MTNHYRFYIDNLLLPVNPDKLTVKYNSKNKTETLINNGEINILKRPGLTEMSMELLLPQQAYPFALYETEFLPAQYYLKALKDIKERNTPVYFKVLRADMNGVQLWDTLNFLCTLESYSYTEDASKGFDITASVTLKQYRAYGTQAYQVDETGSAQLQKDRPIGAEKKSETPSEDQPKAYTVQAGDSLWTICKKQYGDGEKWREIAEKNNISNPNLIHPGQVITLA